MRGAIKRLSHAGDRTKFTVGKSMSKPPFVPIAVRTGEQITTS